MAKRLFLLLLVSFLGIFDTPNILMASDSFGTLAPGFSAVETPEVLPEPEPEPESTKSESTSYVAPVKKSETAQYTPVSAPSVINYNVTITTNEMIAKNLSYSDVYRFKKLIYGHNSGNLLGNLSSLSVGQVFTITEGGITKEYRVANTTLYRKTSDGNLEGDKTIMKNIAYKAMGHSVALMTCAGTSYGNGDASHRLVVFADTL